MSAIALAREYLPDKRVRYTAGFLLALALYISTGEFGLHFYTVNTFVTLIWPPAGIAIVALVIGGYALWPAIAIGSLAITLSTGAPIPVALILAFSSTFQAVLGLYLLRSVIRFDPFFGRLRDGIGFVITALVITACGASIGVLPLYVSNLVSASDVSSTFIAWWIGHFIGILSTAPFLLYWGAAYLHDPSRHTVRLRARSVVPVLVTTGIIVLLFWTPYSSIGPISLLYPLIFGFIWVAIETGSAGTTIALFLMSTVGVLGLLFGYSNVTQEFSEKTLLSAQIILGTIDIIFLIFMTVIEDRIEAMRALKENLLQTQEELEQSRLSDSAKADFISVLAHELRNPLASVLTGLEIFEIEDLPNHVRAQTDAMKKNVHIMSRILDDLLDTARISREGFVLHKEVVELRSVLRQALATVEPNIAGKDHSVLIEMPEKPIVLLGDSVRLAQIFINLLTNAAKFTNSGGRIRVSLAHGNGFASVRVSDNGIGIEPEALAGIFSGIERGDSSRRLMRGLGIGLPLVKRLTELHGGTIEAKSGGAGHGSVFTVRLPLDLSLAPEADSASASNARSLATSVRRWISKPHTRSRVLIIDDNEAAAKSLATLLRRAGHEVETAFSGVNGLTSAKRIDPDIILLDIGMPGMDGHSVARELIKSGSRAFIVALTGYGLAEERNKAFASGFERFLVKPVSAADIESVIEEYVAYKVT